MKKTYSVDTTKEYESLPLLVRHYLKKIDMLSKETQLGIWVELTKKLDADIDKNTSQEAIEYKKLRWPQIDHTNTI